MTEARTEVPINCDEATAPELAAAVVGYIEKYGWTDRSLGYPHGAVCLVGGIAAVCSGDPRDGYELCISPTSSLLRLAEALQEDGEIPVKINSRLAGDRLLGEAETTPYVLASSIYSFNDKAGQTMNGALNPLRRVAGLPEVNE